MVTVADSQFDLPWYRAVGWLFTTYNPRFPFRMPMDGPGATCVRWELRKAAASAEQETVRLKQEGAEHDEEKIRHGHARDVRHIRRTPAGCTGFIHLSPTTPPPSKFYPFFGGGTVQMQHAHPFLPRQLCHGLRGAAQRHSSDSPWPSETLSIGGVARPRHQMHSDPFEIKEKVERTKVRATCTAPLVSGYSCQRYLNLHHFTLKQIICIQLI